MAELIWKYINLVRRYLGCSSYLLVSNIFVDNWALVSYLREPTLFLKDNDKLLDGHSNKWESREIAKILKNKGFNVEIIDWNDEQFKINRDYKIVVDIGSNLARWKTKLNPRSLKWMHLTGSYPVFQNDAEKARIIALKGRKPGVVYSPKRTVSDYKKVIESIGISNACSLIGNNDTLLTYPKKYWPKITLVPVTASRLTYYKKNDTEYFPKDREFLWYFGAGAVHKGLDLVLESFLVNKELKLNIVGNIENEDDFKKIYKKEIYNTSNIKYYGFLDPTSEKFVKILKKCFCFIAPSCSESISTSVVTCMQIGLYPIISRHVGVNLPRTCGLYLEDLSVKSISSAVNKVNKMSKDNFVRQVTTLQEYSFLEFSRDKFNRSITNYIEKII